METKILLNYINPKVLFYLPQSISLESMAEKSILLPPTIASIKPPVLKMPLQGEIDEDGYENHLLYLPKSAFVKSHEHKRENGVVEFYRRLYGALVCNGFSCDYNYCGLGQTHNIEETREDTLVEAVKIDVKRLVFKKGNRR